MNNNDDSFDIGLNHTLGGEDEDFEILNNEQIASCIVFCFLYAYRWKFQWYMRILQTRSIIPLFLIS